MATFVCVPVVELTVAACTDICLVSGLAWVPVSLSSISISSTISSSGGVAAVLGCVFGAGGGGCGGSRGGMPSA